MTVRRDAASCLLAEGRAPDLEATLAGFDGDFGLFAEVAGVFVADFPRLLASIRASLDDPKALAPIAHELKGAAGYFFAAEVVEAASELESMGRDCDLAAARAVYGRLRDAGARLLAAIEAFGPDGWAPPSASPT